MNGADGKETRRKEGGLFVTIRSVRAMRWRRTGRSEVGRKGGQNGLSCAIFSAYSTRVNAGIAQLVEQLICNQQVVGSNPTAGSIVNRGFTIIAESLAWPLFQSTRLFRHMRSRKSRRVWTLWTMHPP